MIYVSCFEAVGSYLQWQIYMQPATQRESGVPRRKERISKRY
jgi:hypothetical protein